jgi:putative addiction module component (TIGR02574 family)
MRFDSDDGILPSVTDRARKLLDEALGLPDEDRARLAAELLASLPDDDRSDEWRAELERRARRAHADPDGGVPWDRVRADLLADLRRR